MPQFRWLDPKPFFFPAGPVGLLLIHGFTGAPPEMRPMGEYLAQRGLTVAGPLLAGHGTTPEDLARTTWQDWYASIEAAFQGLRPRCEKVFVAGFSLGAVLALHLAAHHELAGLVLMAPALWVRDWRMGLVPVLRHFIKFVAKDTNPQHSDLTDPEAYKRFWSYDVYPAAGVYQMFLLQRLVRSELERIRLPTLIIYATKDMSIAPQSGPLIYKRIPATDKELLVLHHSGHGLVADSECELVFQQLYAWITSR